ncbi:Anaphase-promoting complex subunit 1 [Cynara cardunculus var. scolymus]|uniref:Anaphase-promoting complex subunit 1 n=1 Tax=Cynara cardunculus var. scolymus TaxID=59895 RepID=A0A103XQB1_CYNCS|nr:Anaphase-promoting complex subunit 1 [Cynara cardunculus var. scolymus]
MQFSHLCPPRLFRFASILFSLSILPFFSTLSSRSIVEYHCCNISWKPAMHHLSESHRCIPVGNLAMTPGFKSTIGSIGRRSGSDNVLEREGYVVSVGFSLGLVAFGRGLDAIGFTDTLVERLFQYVSGKEIHNMMDGTHINIDVTIPGAILCFGSYDSSIKRLDSGSDTQCSLVLGGVKGLKDEIGESDEMGCEAVVKAM